MPRTRRPKRKRQSKGLALTQILLLTGILLVMLVFRHHIGDTISTLMGSFGDPASDVQVAPDNAASSSEGDSSQDRRLSP